MAILLSNFTNIFKINKIRNYSFGKKKEKDVLIYSSKEDLLFFRSKPFQYLNYLEQIVLMYLINNIETYIPIQKINSIIEIETQTSNYNTVIRKREAIINMLKNKLSILLNVNCDNIILERRNKNDRRIKEIKLNKENFKIN